MKGAAGSKRDFGGKSFGAGELVQISGKPGVRRWKVRLGNKIENCNKMFRLPQNINVQYNI